MSASKSYSVTSTGKVLEGFDETQVGLRVAEIFKIEPEKATEFLINVKLIRKGLSEKEAEHYRSNLNSIGLDVSIANAAANEPDLQIAGAMGAKSIPVVIGDRQTRLEPAASESVKAEFACPKCRKIQDKKAECIQCGIIFEKYESRRIERSDARHGNGANTRKSNVTDDVNEGSNSPIIIKSILALLVVGVVAFFTFDRGSSDSDLAGVNADGKIPPAGRSDYHVKSTMSRETEALLRKAGFEDLAKLFPGKISEKFRTDFREEAKSRNAPKPAVQYVLGLPTKAYNASALFNSMGNWLELRFTPENIKALSELYDSPSIEKGVAANLAVSRNSNDAEYEAFAKTLANNPLKGQRKQVISTLVDLVEDSKTKIALINDINRMVLKAAGNIAANRDSLEEQRKTNQKVADNLDLLNMVQEMVYQDSVSRMAFTYKDFSTSDLQKMRSAYDNELHKKFSREFGKGMNNFLYYATSWLNMEVRNAGY